VSSLLPGWSGTDLAAAFGDAYAAPVVAGNDSKLAALGERWRGGATDAEDVVYVHVGRRISAGILLGGTVLHGRHGAAGEIGVLPGSGWHTAHQRLLERWGTPEALFDAVRDDEPAAVQALDDFAADLVQGIAAVVLSVDPEAVVIGGGLSRAGELLLAPLRSRLAELCLFPVTVVASRLGDEAAAQGAVRLALDQVEAELFATGSERRR
ncbi:ROK family protein, partial [Streptomyces sp. SID14478]|uniref:ROK family protein n=1 Tax=Streptomyces sp. SID14478 TaxID=2706073 RepID=UPI0013DF7BF6